MKSRRVLNLCSSRSAIRVVVTKHESPKSLSSRLFDTVCQGMVIFEEVCEYAGEPLKGAFAVPVGDAAADVPEITAFGVGALARVQNGADGLPNVVERYAFVACPVERFLPPFHEPVDAPSGERLPFLSVTKPEHRTGGVVVLVRRVATAPSTCYGERSEPVDEPN